MRFILPEILFSLLEPLSLGTKQNKITMKNLKKMSREKLREISGAVFNCSGCPTGGYGPGGTSAGYDFSCEDYHVLPGRCKSCVFVSSECFQ